MSTLGPIPVDTPIGVSTIGEVPSEFHAYVRTLLSLGQSLSIAIESADPPRLVIDSAVDV